MAKHDASILRNVSECYLENKTLLQTRCEIAFGLANTLSGAVAIFGNFLIVLAVYKTSSLRTPTNYFISSMSLADFQVGVIAVPLWISRVLLNITESEHILCIISDFITIQTLMASTYSLCCITVDRYIAITSVYHYSRIMTLRRCYTAIAFAWALTFILGSFRFLVEVRSDLPKFYVSASIAGIIVPFTIIGYCYTHILKAAKAQKRKIATLTTRFHKDSVKEHKAAHTIAIIIGVYIAFWTPAFLVSILDFVAGICLYDAWLATVSISLANAAINPWIYAARNNHFWDAFKRILLQRHETAIRAQRQKLSIGRFYKPSSRINAAAQIEGLDRHLNYEIRNLDTGNENPIPDN